MSKNINVKLYMQILNLLLTECYNSQLFLYLDFWKKSYFNGEL